jgi:hypothetical protein
MLVRATAGRCSSILHAPWSARQKVLLLSTWRPCFLPSNGLLPVTQRLGGLCSATGRKRQTPVMESAQQEPSDEQSSQKSAGRSSGKRQRAEEDGSEGVLQDGTATVDGASEGASTAGQNGSKREQKRNKKEKKPLGEVGCMFGPTQKTITTFLIKSLSFLRCSLGS